MKVLFISNDPLIFDADSAVRTRMREYATLFDELHVVSRAPKSCTQNICEQNLILHPVPYMELRRLVVLYTRAKRIVHECGIDVVSAQDPFELGLIGVLARIRTRAKLHVQLHTDMFSSHFWLRPPWNIVRLWIARIVLRHAHGIRTITERLQAAIRVAYRPRARISVLPIFTDVGKFKALPRLKHPRFKIALLVVSRLEKEKNVSLAIHTIKNARDTGHDAGLTIVGDGSERVALQVLVRSLGLERFVEFVGQQNNIKPYLETADLLLFPSHYDGYGLVVIEALAAGIPVLATDVGVAREAGAIIASQDEFSKTLVRWIESGPRQGELHSYQYADKNMYLARFKTDLELCAKQP